MDKKKLLALLIFLIMGFFMVSFANPSEELRPVATDTKEETPTNNDANQTNVNPTRNTTNVNRGSQTIVTPVQPQDTTPVTDPTNDGIGNVDVVEYTVVFVDYANNVLKSQTVEEHSSANADDINVNDYTVAGITYSFTKWDKDFSDVTQNLTVKALYDVEKIIAHVYINGEKTDDTVEIKVNDDTKNQKDVKLTDDNIDDYIVNKDELPEAKDGKENEIDKLTFDEEEGYIVEINEEFIDYNVRAFDGALVEKVEAIKAHMGDEVKLSHKDKKGYTFKYYIVIENNNRVTFEKEDTTITVHTSDIDVYAFYEVNTYEITYELDGGSTTNVTTYTVEDEVVLSDATKTGYNFTKWTENGKTITKIAKGSTGNKTITAHYEAREDIEYTVEFYKENLTYENGKYSFVEKETRNNGVADKENNIAVNKTYTGFKTPAAKKVVIAADGSTVVQFYFDREEYTVTFKNFDITNLNRVLEEKVKYEAAATTAPTLTNNDDYNGYKYTFNGWDKEFSYITGNTVVTANLTKEINTYTINYVIDNLTTTTNTTSYTVKDEVVFTDAVKKGYDFIKWTDENGQPIKKIAKGSTGNRTITAHFEASTNTKYTVKVYKEKLDYQSAEDRYTVTSKEYKDGITDTNKTITAPIFEGFTTTIESLTKKIDAEGTTVYEFFYNRDIHTLTFKVDGEVYGNVQSLKYGQAIVVPTYTAAEGYTFHTWTNVAATMGTEDLVYNATTTANKNTKYTIIINEENVDGTFKTTREVKTGETDKTIKVTVPNKTGFTVDATSKEVTITGDGKAEVVFNYTRETHTLTFKVDGEVYGNVQTLKYGQAIVVPTYTAAEGYTFHTWTNVAATMGTEDLVYNATTTANTNTKYTVIVNEENVDGTIKTTKEEKEGTTGTTVTVRKANKTGFVLDATSKDVTITGDGKAEVVFNYTRERHTVTFKVNGEVYGNVQTLKYGETITKPSYTVAEGYNFSGWTNVAATMGTEDLVYDATYAIKKFTVKWSVDGRIVETDENVEYGSKPKYDSATPAKASVTDESGYTYNYTYTGWKDLTDETVITSDKTFVAELVTLKATVKDNKQLSYTRESNVDVKDDIIVQVVDHAGNVVKTLTKSEYTTNFDNSELTYNNKKNLVINYTYKNKALTNNKLFYEVLRKAFNSKFEVKLSIGNSYRKTTDPNCTKDCDTQDNTDEVSLDHNILEVIEHYNQLVQVQSISANYGNGETALEFITKKDYYGRVKPSSVRWSDAVHYSNGNVEYYNPVYIAQKVGYDYSNTYVKDSKGGTVKHGQKYPDHSYVKHWLREDSDMTGKICNDTNLLGKAVDCSYDYRYVARTNQTSGLYRIENNEFVSYKPSGYVNVDEEGHRIQTVTVYYHRNENLDEHETEGNFVVVFEYDRVLNKFVCIDEHEVK